MTIRYLLAFSLLSLLISATALAAGTYQLQKSGIPIIDQMTTRYRQSGVSQADLDRIIREIAQDGLFQKVFVRKVNSNTVVIEAEQSKKITKIKIVGNVTFSDSELLDKMKIKAGDILSQLEVAQAISRVEKTYEESGFYNFQVKLRKVPVEAGVQLIITVDESDYCVIEDIEIFSKSEYLNQLMQGIILKYQGKSYKQQTSQNIMNDIKDNLLSNRFLTARVQNSATVFNPGKTKVKIKFTVDNATQFEFVFHGNKYFSHFDLLKNSGMGEKFLYTSDSSSEIIDGVTALYLRSGFPNVKINHTEDYFASENKRVFVFKIDEGPRVRIGKINISGKISRKKSYYVSLFNELLGKEAHSVFFVQKDIENAAANMITALKRSGHLQAELLSANVDFINESTAQINLQIDEGILTYVRQILFRGAKSFSNPDLRKVVQLIPNEPLNINQIEASFSLLESHYKNQGYLEFVIKNRNAEVIKYNPGQPYADIVYEVKEGPKIRVKSITVNGTSKTRPYIVERELDFRVGDVLTLKKVALSVQRLERTSLYGKVNIRTLEENTDITERNIMVEVEERKPGLFSSGVGIENNGLLSTRGYVGTLYNNLWGKARAVSGRVDLRYRNRVEYLENRLALTYYEPYLSRDRLRARVSLVREEQFIDFSNVNGTEVPRILSTNDIRISTEKEYGQHTRFTYNVWGLSNQESFNARTDENFNVINIGSTGPILELDYRNDEFLPTSGTYSRFEFEYSDPLLGSSRDNPAVSGAADETKEINYFKTYFSTTRYTPLTKDRRWVWVNSLRGGYLRNVSSREDSGVPRVRSFFLGGSSTIRGFTSIDATESAPGKRELCIKQGLDTLGQPTTCNIDDIFIRDDSAFFLIKSELRFPISGALGGLIFYDGGAVYLGEFSLEDPYRDAIGMGIRFDTPVGAFSLELGYKLDRKQGGDNTLFDAESDVAFHLSIGNF